VFCPVRPRRRSHALVEAQRQTRADRLVLRVLRVPTPTALGCALAAAVRRDEANSTRARRLQAGAVASGPCVCAPL
jgi:hypothetical protein